MRKRTTLLAALLALVLLHACGQGSGPEPSVQEPPAREEMQRETLRLELTRSAADEDTLMQALRMRLQSFGIATQLTQMLPYLAALIGIKLTGMRMRAPAANGTPYSHPLSAPCLRRKSAGESQSKGSKA